MTQLLLVRHGHPEIQPGIPSKHWALSEKGRQQSLSTAEQLRVYHPKTVVTSEEPKAAETGQIIADALNLPLYSALGLEEHDRTGVPYFDEPAEFEAAVKSFFERPAKQVFGDESADEAQKRFVTAVKNVLEPYAEQTVVVVAHGTVNTLFTRAFNSVAPFVLWKIWPLAGFAVFSCPNFRLLESPQLKS